jgi:type VI secretion system FHA domain protein
MLGPSSQAVFTAAGGSIGRRPGNDWVLPDGHVSGRHARVRAIGGTFFLEDNESANGVTVNGNRLHPGEPFPLKDGDKLFIDPFEIAVAVSMTKPGASTEFQSMPPPVLPSVVREVPSDLGSGPIVPSAQGAGGLLGDISLGPPGFDDLVPEAGAGLPSDFNPLLDEAPAQSSPPVYTAESLQSKAVLHDVLDLTPPAPRQVAPTSQAGMVIPTNWDALNEPDAPPVGPVVVDAVPSPAVVPVVQVPVPSSAVASEGDFGSLLRAAGVPGGQVAPEVMAEFGEVLRVVVEGLMEVLRARGEIRNEFRLPQTTFKVRDNNPLKMAVNAEDAVHNLLVKRNPAYLGTTAAFEDAFQDVRHHQLAMLAGMRAAYAFMLKRFDPAALKAQFDAKPGRKGFGFSAQARYWESFEEYYREATADADDCFRRLFGDQFARAYEEQIQLLRSSQDRARR